MLILYRTMRKVHLWVGLALAVFVLIEAVTGLILLAPEAEHGQRQAPTEKTVSYLAQEKLPSAEDPGRKGTERPAAGTRPEPSGVYGLAKSLHQGKIGNVNLTWLVALSGTGIVILTVTGTYLAVCTLRARYK